jgi:hypothetical protein
MSTPLLGFLLFHDNYIFECIDIQHHTDECAGYCELKKELASQTQKGTEIPVPALQKQLKVIDILHDSFLQMAPLLVCQNILLSYCHSSLLYVRVEIETPPPQFLSI